MAKFQSSLPGTANVRDADTIDVDSVRVRLEGLHRPEADEPGGDAATRAMRQLTRGSTMRCTLTGERTYDRIVGTCYVGKTDLTAAIIREGVCARCPRHDSQERYLAAQREAGAWRGSMPGFCSKSPTRRPPPHQHVGGARHLLIIVEPRATLRQRMLT